MYIFDQTKEEKNILEALGLYPGTESAFMYYSYKENKLN